MDLDSIIDESDTFWWLTSGERPCPIHVTRLYVEWAGMSCCLVVCCAWWQVVILTIKGIVIITASADIMCSLVLNHLLFKTRVNTALRDSQLNIFSPTHPTKSRENNVCEYWNVIKLSLKYTKTLQITQETHSLWCYFYSTQIVKLIHICCQHLR